MKILCPNCGVRGSADDSYCDRNVKCPKCQTIFTVLSDMDIEREPVSQAEIAPGVDAGALESSEVEQDIAVETAVAELDEQSTIEKDGLDWAEVAAEIDQQLQADDSLVGIEAEEPEEGSELLDDLAAHDESLLAQPIARLTEEDDDVDGAQDLAEDETVEDASPVITDDDIATITAEDTKDSEVEEEPYGVAKEQCWQCGKEDSVGEPFIAKDGRLYCTNCVPEEPDVDEELSEELAEYENHIQSVAAGDGEDHSTELAGRTTPYFKFTITEALKEAWARTKGAKGTIWAGSAVMYLVILVLVAGGAFLLPSAGTAMSGVATTLGTVLFQLVTDVASVLFTAGLLYIGIRKVVGDPISWKMITRGFSCAGSIIIATILQSVLVLVGLLLLVLPGIYLAVGYAMTMPLIVDQGLSPWQAMETSRKAIHKVWWKVFGLFFIMGLIMAVSLLPLGIGLIWTWPMFIILAGVVYCYLFGGMKRAG